MSKFKAFMKPNVKAIENVKVKLDRFEEEIELCPISLEAQEQILEKCKVFKPNKKGKMEETMSESKFVRFRALHSIVFPDLNDTELQKSYGVLGAEQLLNALFLADEISTLMKALDPEERNFEDAVNEAKN